MNPMLIAQAASAVTGLIGGFIPDKTRQKEVQTHTDGSNLAGRVEGAVGPQSTSTFVEEQYQPGIKKGLLTASKLLGVAGSVGSLAEGMGLKLPNISGQKLREGLNEFTSSLVKTNSSLLSTPKTILPDEPYVDDIPSSISGLAETTVPQFKGVITNPDVKYKGR
jgi:hypothetical protein